MKLYRLTKAKYGNDRNGKGTEMSGGRWNSKGVDMLYTAQSTALATTAIAVHVPLGILPKNYVIVVFEVDNTVTVEELKQDKLPVDWKFFPHSHATQIIGDEFIMSGKALILKVPSVVVEGDFNYLVNLNHPDIHRIQMISTKNYEFDERLLK